MPWVTEVKAGTGVSGHAVLERAKGTTAEAWRSIADATVRRLCTEGYSFDGHKQNPLGISEALEGAELALDWLTYCGAAPAHAEVEIGLAVDGSGAACAYQGAWYQAVIDLVQIDEEGNDEDSYWVRTVADYKSSWQAGPAELETLQRKGQAVVVAAHYQDWDVLRLEVRNLRSRKVYSKDIINDADGLELLKRWREEVLLASEITREAMLRGGAAPGPGCLGCPFRYACDDAEKKLSTERISDQWVMASIMADGLRPLVAKLAKNGPVPIEGGRIEFVGKERKAVSDDAAGAAVGYWGTDVSFDSVVGLVKALRIGVGQVNSLAKVMRKTHGDAVADDFLSEAIYKESRPELTITKVSPNPVAEEKAE